MASYTSDLEKVRKNPECFLFGKVVEIHDFHRYTIVESDYVVKDGPNQIVRREFRCYVNGKLLRCAAKDLDQALIICIAFANLGNAESTDYMAQAAYKLLTP